MPTETKAARVYLFADFGKGPRSFGTCTKAPEHARGDRFSLSFKGDAIYGTNRQRIAARDARRWWLVECESADAGRELIELSQLDGCPDPDCTDRDCDGERHDEDYWTPAGRILDSGGAA